MRIPTGRDIFCPESIRNITTILQHRLTYFRLIQPQKLLPLVGKYLRRAHLDIILENNPRIVLLTLGGNDLKNGVPRKTAFNNLEVIIHGSASLSSYSHNRLTIKF